MLVPSTSMLDRFSIIMKTHVSHMKNECILFPSVFKEFGDLLHWEKLFIVKGKVEVSFGVYNINIEKIASLQQWLNRIKKNKSLFKYNFD